jgi:hypothetical protein
MYMHQYYCLYGRSVLFRGAYARVCVCAWKVLVVVTTGWKPTTIVVNRLGACDHGFFCVGYVSWLSMVSRTARDDGNALGTRGVRLVWWRRVRGVAANHGEERHAACDDGHAECDFADPPKERAVSAARL